jgi:hypothetical protein
MTATWEWILDPSADCADCGRKIRLTAHRDGCVDMACGGCTGSVGRRDGAPVWLCEECAG